jgi:hypothetical protein
MRLGDYSALTFDCYGTLIDWEAPPTTPALEAGADHFRLALARLAELGVPKDRVLQVAQSLCHDHVPAQRLGLSTIWVNRRADRGPNGGATPPAPVPVILTARSPTWPRRSTCTGPSRQVDLGSPLGPHELVEQSDAPPSGHRQAPAVFRPPLDPSRSRARPRSPGCPPTRC